MEPRARHIVTSWLFLMSPTHSASLKIQRHTTFGYVRKVRHNESKGTLNAHREQVCYIVGTSNCGCAKPTYDGENPDNGRIALCSRAFRPEIGGRSN